MRRSIRAAARSGQRLSPPSGWDKTPSSRRAESGVRWLDLDADGNALSWPGRAVMRSATSACSMTIRRLANGGPTSSRRRIAGDATWYGRLATTTKSCSKNADGSTSRMSAVSTLRGRGGLGAQPVGKRGVDLDGDDLACGVDQALGEHPQAGTNLEDVVARGIQARGAHDRRRDRLIVQKRLGQGFARPKPERAQAPPSRCRRGGLAVHPLSIASPPQPRTR